MLFFKLNSPRKPLTEIEEHLLYEEIKEINPDVLAFSLVSPNFKLYQKLYKKIRSLGDFKILVGGWQASLNPMETIRYCDILCRGEGEEAIPELIEAIQNRKKIYSIPNIWFKAEDLIIETPVRPLTQNLSQYPNCIIDNSLASYIEDNKIVRKDPYVNNIRYGTSVGRGCYYKCNFCSNSFMATELYPKEWSRIRYRTIDHIIEELKQAKAKIPNLKCINFYDEIFLPPKEWVEEFFIRYKKEIDFPFYCMFFPGTCKEELLKLMVPAGLTGVWMGVQSGSERVRKEVFKRFYSNETVLNQAFLFVKYGINVKYDFIFDNPFETIEETEESIQLMKMLPNPKSFNMFSLKFFPQTKITEMALRQGFITKKDLDDQLEIESPRYEISEERKKEILELIK
jgi:radical SAM superfamily enzyme YgiQ (UPF0313 family)